MDGATRRKCTSIAITLLYAVVLSYLTGCPAPGDNPRIHPGDCFITMPDKYIEYFQVEYLVPDNPYDAQKQTDYFRAAIDAIPKTGYTSDGYDQEKRYYAIVLEDPIIHGGSDPWKYMYKCGAVFRIDEIKDPKTDMDALISATPIVRSPISKRDEYYPQWDIVDNHARMRKEMGENVLERR